MLLARIESEFVQSVGNFLSLRSIGDYIGTQEAINVVGGSESEGNIVPARPAGVCKLTCAQHQPVPTADDQFDPVRFEFFSEFAERCA